MSIRLNEKALIQEVLEGIPHKDGKIICSTAEEAA
jgi:hypothetical protein